MFQTLRDRIERRRREQATRIAAEKKRIVDANRAAQEQRNRIIQYQKNVIDILHSGGVPSVPFSIKGDMPFKFQRSEHLLWVFGTAEYLEQKTRRAISGRSAGASVRVAKGLSVRFGQSAGHPVEYNDIVSFGKGTLAITTKHIYFTGDRSVRIPIGKIISIQWDGGIVCVTRDRASGQPEYLDMGSSKDARFVFDVLHAVPSPSDGFDNPEPLAVEEYHLLPHDDAEGFESDD